MAPLYFQPLWLFQGAFWGIAVGHTCGLVRMVLDFVYPVPDCGEPDNRPAIVANLHYSYFGQLSLVITSISIVVISLLTKPQDKESVTSFIKRLAHGWNKSSIITVPVYNSTHFKSFCYCTPAHQWLYFERLWKNFSCIPVRDLYFSQKFLSQVVDADENILLDRKKNKCHTSIR